MKEKLVLIAVCALFAFSCSRKEQAPPQPQLAPAQKQKSTTSLNVVGEYTGAMIMAHRKAKDTSALITLRQFIQTYNALNERFPRDLNEISAEMKKEGYEMPQPPRGQQYNYNPETGEIYLYYSQEEKTNQ